MNIKTLSISLFLLHFIGCAQDSLENSKIGFPNDTLWLTKNGELRDSFVIEGIFFQLAVNKLYNKTDTARGVVKPKRIYSQLDSLALLLIEDGGQFEVGCHLDGRVSKFCCERLSGGRAKTIYSYLLSRGVSEKNLTYKGYEGDLPRNYFGIQLTNEFIFSLESAEEKEKMHQLNRRIALKRID